MSSTAISVDRISKSYRIGLEAPRYATFRDLVANAVKAPIQRLRRLQEHRSGQGRDVLWALRDVDLEVEAGESVGIIGRNGAGKTTLLKILSRITEPTSGEARIRGRVGSLLEVGTGFHEELTGRENIFLNGAILGMRRDEIKRKFDEIVAFSQVERFLDTPMKRYSSGMKVRLAFSVAAHLEPEILFVDEVLAVGDAAFQKKCLDKMDDVTGHGRTILFVSHNMSAIQSICQRVVWLDGGRVRQVGTPSEVVSNYLETIQAGESAQTWEDFASAPGNDKVRFRRAVAEPAEGGDQITTRVPIDLSFEYWNLQPDVMVNLSVYLYNREGNLAFSTGPATDTEWRTKPKPAGLFRTRIRIPGDLLNDGYHRITVLVVEQGHRVVYQYRDALVFNVLDDGSMRGSWHGNWEGAVRPILAWKTEWIGEVPTDT